jgi:protein-disulfide isomerase
MRGLPLRVAFRHFALRAKHPRAVALALAAEAAGMQGRFWEMHDALYAEPGRLDDPHLWERAERLGLDIDRFDVDRRAVETAARIARQLRDGMRAGVAVTPTLFIDGIGHPGPPDAAMLRLLTADAGQSSSMVGFG